MWKRVLSLAAVFLLLLSLSVNAAARWDKNQPALVIKGTTAYCSIDYQSAKTTDKVKVTLTLWCGESPVDSWTESGTGGVVISEECSVVRGNTYRLVATPVVNGVAKPQLSVTADS